jgi:putative Holliday junction resolvase
MTSGVDPGPGPTPLARSAGQDPPPAAPTTTDGSGWWRGVRLGVDVGKVRVGVARSDPDGILASPVATLARDLTAAAAPAAAAPAAGAVRAAGTAPAAAPPPGAASAGTAPGGTAPAGTAPGGTAPAAGAAGERVPSDITQIAALVREEEAVEVVVGLPVTLAGREALAAADVRDYVGILARVIAPVPVRLSDERMTTVVASRRLAERGVRGRRQRAVVDQVAAVEILQGWLDNQRRRTR